MKHIEITTKWKEYFEKLMNEGGVRTEEAMKERVEPVPEFSVDVVENVL